MRWIFYILYCVENHTYSPGEVSVGHGDFHVLHHGSLDALYGFAGAIGDD